ncbi:MAG TPA: CoA transferase [bacterium]|nr:CoA transferase [bacterium]
MGGILDGLSVLDLTRNVAGPYCTMILGDLGAEVIKIERPGSGDDTREWQPPAWNGRSTTYLGLNRNKKSLAVNLDDADGTAIVHRLAARADVVVESFRVGSMAKRGLGYEQVSAENPRVIYCSITGFGLWGPHRDRPAYDPIIQAYSGIMSMTGEPTGPPVRVGPSVVDMGAGLWGALGILGALYQRQRTGRGSRVDTSLLEVGVAWIGYHLPGYLATGKIPGRMGSRSPMIAPYEAFAARDGYLQLAAPNDQIFVRLCLALELTGLVDDGRFRTNAARIANREALHEALEARLRTHTAARWEEILLAQRIPCSRIRTVDEVAVDPQVEALRLLMPVEHPAIAGLRLIDLPVAIDGERAANRGAPPDLGQHSQEVLAGLGYDGDRIDDLRRRGVIG